MVKKPKGKDTNRIGILWYLQKGEKNAVVLVLFMSSTKSQKTQMGFCIVVATCKHGMDGGFYFLV